MTEEEIGEGVEALATEGKIGEGVEAEAGANNYFAPTTPCRKDNDDVGTIPPTARIPLQPPRFHSPSPLTGEGLGRG